MCLLTPVPNTIGTLANILPLLTVLKQPQDFPGGTVEKNLPANARDIGSIPGLERCHMSRSNKAWCATTSELALQSPQTATTEAHVPRPCNKRSHHNEKPVRHNKEQPHLPQLEKACVQQPRPCVTNNKNKLFKKQRQVEKKIDIQGLPWWSSG